MDTIYIDAKDKNVAVTIVYGKADRDFLYYDDKLTQKITKEDAFELFIKGVLVLMNNEYYKLVHCKVSGSGYVFTAYNGTVAITLKTEGAA